MHLINPYRLQSRNKGRTKGSHKRNATTSYFLIVDFLRIFLIAAELGRSVAAIERARLCRSAKSRRGAEFVIVKYASGNYTDREIVTFLQHVAFI